MDIQRITSLLLNKLQNLHVYKYKYDKQVFNWYYIHKKKFIIHPEYFDANNIFSRPVFHHLKHKSNMVQNLSRQMKIALKNRYWITVLNIRYTKYNVSLAVKVKHNIVEGRMRKTKLY